MSKELSASAKSLSKSRECFIEVYIDNRCLIIIIYYINTYFYLHHKWPTTYGVKRLRGIEIDLMIYAEGGSTMVEWGSVTHQMAVPVPSISCCVINLHNLFYQIQNALVFNCDTCCHLALCLWLLPFHYWHILIRQRGRIPLLALGEWKTVKSYFNKFLILGHIKHTSFCHFQPVPVMAGYEP